MENFRFCRICITESPVMMSIFGEDALWEKISSFAQVDIVEGDNLPQQICMICAKSAMNAYIFKQKCEEADRFFHQQVVISDADEPWTSNSPAQSVGDAEEDSYHLVHQSIRGQKNFPLLIEPTVSKDNLCGSGGNTDNDDHYDLPLIPEIEIHTPIIEKEIKPIATSRGYQCSICFEFFAMKAILKHHVNQCHPNMDRIYECFDCKKNYTSQRFLEKHVRMRNCCKQKVDREVKCSGCEVMFSSENYFEWHKKSGLCGKTNDPSILLSFDSFGIIDSQSEEKREPFSDASRELEKTPIKNRRKTFRPKKIKRAGVKIKLESRAALAEALIQENASTPKLAKELNISRTFAWQLRKTLINSVSINRMSNTIDSSDIPISTKDTTFVNSSHNFIQKRISEKNSPINEENNFLATTVSLPQDECAYHLEEQDSDEEECNEAYDSENYSPNNIKSRPSCSQTDSSLTYDFTSQKRTNNTNDNIQRRKKRSKHHHSVTKKCNDKPGSSKKPRKPNVFIDNQKYEQAKVLVANNATTMDVARRLDISQMSAWKLRDCILKGTPLTFKKPPERRPKPEKNTWRPREPRRRLKGKEKLERDNQITKEILSLIKVDSHIQYWKVSEILTEKGLPMSPSSVCQKLKSLGIHRRWKSSAEPFVDSNMSKASSTDDLSGTGDTTT